MATNNIINTPVPFSVPKGGTGVSTLTTPYGLLAAGTTATAPIQTVSPGSAAQLLTSAGASSLPSFKASPAAILAKVTGASGATVDFANVFSSSYEIYLMAYENYLPSTNNTVLSALFGTGATPTYQTTGYFGTIYGFNGTASAAVTYLPLSASETNVAHFEANGYFYIFNVNNSPSSVAIAGILNSFSQGSFISQSQFISGGWQGASPVTSLRFAPSSGNIASGNFYLYGLNL